MGGKKEAAKKQLVIMEYSPLSSKAHTDF